MSVVYCRGIVSTHMNARVLVKFRFGLVKFGLTDLDGLVDIRDILMDNFLTSHISTKYYEKEKILNK